MVKLADAIASDGCCFSAIASDGCCFSAKPGSADASETDGLSAERLHGGAARVAAENAVGGAAEKDGRDGGGSAAGDAAGGAARDRARDAGGDAGGGAALTGARYTTGDADGDAAGRAAEDSPGNVDGIANVGNGKPAMPHGAAGHTRRGSGAEEGHNSITLVLCCAAAAFACNAAAASEVGELFETKAAGKLDSVLKSPGCAESTLVSNESGPAFCETDTASLESALASAELASALSDCSLASSGSKPALIVSASALCDSASASSESDSRLMTSGCSSGASIGSADAGASNGDSGARRYLTRLVELGVSFSTRGRPSSSLPLSPRHSCIHPHSLVLMTAA